MTVLKSIMRILWEKQWMKDVELRVEHDLFEY